MRVTPLSRFFALLAAALWMTPGCVSTASVRDGGALQPVPSEAELQSPAPRALTSQKVVEQQSSESSSLGTAPTAVVGQHGVHPIVGKWLLKRVVDRFAKTTFEPARYGGLTFTERGGVSWSDGCNQTRGKYSVVGHQIHIVGPGGAGFWSCHDYEPEDVHYDPAFEG